MGSRKTMLANTCELNLLMFVTFRCQLRQSMTVITATPGCTAQRQDPIGRSPSTTVPTPVGKPGCSIGFAKEPVITFLLKMQLTIVVVPFATNKLRPMILCPLWRIWRITSLSCESLLKMWSFWAVTRSLAEVQV